MCFSADNRVMLWDIRNAKGSLMCLDQYNKALSASNNEGEFKSCKYFY